YFRKEQWMATLEQIADLFTKDHEKILEYADSLENGIKSVSLVSFNSSKNEFTNDEIDLSVKNWSAYFDPKFGGNDRAPKFMIPTSLNFLLRYSYTKDNKEITEHVYNTLTKIAYG